MEFSPLRTEVELNEENRVILNLSYRVPNNRETPTTDCLYK